MLDKALENVLNIDIVGLMLLVMAGFITYGAKFIAVYILKTAPDRIFGVTTIIKIVGLLIGLFGFFRVTKMI